MELRKASKQYHLNKMCKQTNNQVCNMAELVTEVVTINILVNQNRTREEECAKYSINEC